MNRDLDRLMRRAAEPALSLPETPLAEFRRRLRTATEHALLGGVPCRLRWIADEHVPYLVFHRRNLFRRGS